MYTGLLRRQVKSSSGFRWPHAVVASRLLLGGRKIRGPAIDHSSRHSGPRSPSPRPVETPAHPGLRARPRAVPSGRWPSVLAQTRRLRPQKPRRPSLGLQVAAIPSAMHARCHPETSPKAWLGLLRGLDPGEQGAGGIVEAARTGRRHPGATLAGKESLQNRRVARLVAAARARARSVRRTGTEAHPGPPAHPAQAEAVGGPGGRRPHYLACLLLPYLFLLPSVFLGLGKSRVLSILDKISQLSPQPLPAF